MTDFDAQLLDVSPDDYHQRPGLSASIAATLISRSPLHAWSQHPSYGGRGKSPTKSMDRGAILHRLVLGKGKEFSPVNHDDWRTKAAKADRDAIRAGGRIPVLIADLNDALDAAEKIRAGLAKSGITLDGMSEIGIEWFEPSTNGNVLCRGMMDHVWIHDGRILDLKIVHNAAPDAISRSAENYGYGIQAAAYTRALTALSPALAGRIEFVFAFCEPEEPYAMNLCSPDGAMRELGERRWLRAVQTWSECVRTQKWPGYGEHINPIGPPAWALAKEGFTNDEVI